MVLAGKNQIVLAGKKQMVLERKYQSTLIDTLSTKKYQLI